MSYKNSQAVFNLIAQIPRGKVTTYGTVGKYLNLNPRVVGNILHQNVDPEKYPCHRVVNSQGGLAKNYVFGGEEIQAQKLQSEGVKIVKNKIDLKVFYWHS